MTMREVADGQRVCERCGTTLADRRCPVHGYDVSQWSASPDMTMEPSIDNQVWSAPRVAPSWSPGPAAAARPAARRTWLAAAVAALLLVALLGDHLYLRHAVDANKHAVGQLDQRVAAQLAATNALASRVAAFEKAPDASNVARLVRASVYTIDTPDGLGSGWVAASSASGSVLVTDYHVVASVWLAAGAHSVQVRQDSKTFTGTISRVDIGDDLAAVTVAQTLVPLVRASSGAMIGDEVLVVGSPLGLSGTVANGIVSSFRDGLIQFSAPISPGDSGGPVVNVQGQVIGVAEKKLVGSGVEGLSFAIPITTVCSTVTTC